MATVFFEGEVRPYSGESRSVYFPLEIAFLENASLCQCVHCITCCKIHLLENKNIFTQGVYLVDHMSV
jgi:hypothetical protein